MASSPQHAASRHQDDDDRFNYDDAVDDFLRDIPVKERSNGNPDSAIQPIKDVDEEVKIRKQRAPAPKLDETRLLSDAGIPKLRRIAKMKLKFKGKGHEFSDVSRLLTTYQLWLDDLYPRAKFRDGLSMIEKVGHSKRMQVTRRAWLDETKPNKRERSPERIEDTMNDETTGTGETSQKGGDHNTPMNLEADRPQRDAPDDDDLNALLAEAEQNESAKAAPIQQRKPRGPFEDDDDDDPDEDELDALMAAEPSSDAIPFAKSTQTTRQRKPDNDFADEEEVMADMDW
ncbi:Hypothetical protein R9X50_00502800 [Acrodontium crateriforme]|uniref:Chromosome segregation in meiosis protein n=1 Tax=Acrodontium crateriforme TaxID=150365 RepID=A0AAQ3RD22_9PEZI|nr:Hypothetical protein R9X50_00502800 [Acrodontium crateriforme]